MLVALEHVGVLCVKLFGRHGLLQRLADLRLAWPQVAQEDRVPVRILSDRIAGEVDVDRARQRKRDHQWRRRQVGRSDLRVDAGFEVSVAAEDRRDDQAVVLDGLGHGVRKRPAVADARRAAVADDVELQRLEIREQTGPHEIVGDDARARRQARLDRGTDFESLLDSLFGQQAGAEHHQRIGRVGAAGNGGNSHRSVLQPGFSAADFNVNPA